MEKQMQITGIDIGGTNFRIGTLGLDKAPSFFRKVPVREVFHTKDVLKDLKDYLADYFRMLQEKGIVPAAVCIGFPATLDRERRMVLQAPNVAFMEKLPVVEALTEAFHRPVLIERDVNLALYYDRKKYGLEKSEILAGCYFGTGIGNAIWAFGRLLRGKNGTAGELGHIPVDGNSQPCGCGNQGCMENLAGGKYLTALCRDVYRDTPVQEIFVRHGGDPLLLQFIDRMAATVAAEVNILDPDQMIVGGGVPSMKGFPKERFLADIHRHVRKPYPAENLQVILAKDAEDKCVAGAALYAREMLRAQDLYQKL